MLLSAESIVIFTSSMCLEQLPLMVCGPDDSTSLNSPSED